MLIHKPIVKLGGALVLVSLLVACSSSDDDDDDGGISNVSQEVFTLSVVHAADMEGGADAVVDAANFSALVNVLRQEFPNTVTLSSGDQFISGPFFMLGGDPSLVEELGVPGQGRADIQIVNAIGFQAAALGNHEFDFGTRMLASLIAVDGAYPGQRFPYLSANIDFTADPNLGPLVVDDGQEAGTIANSIAGSTVITVNGERLGIVGITTPTITEISAPGDDLRVFPSNSADLNALAATVQPTIDALVGAGINKIIVLAHLQRIELEIALSALLHDVDIIIAGGSNTILADSDDVLRAGDEVQGEYPTMTLGADGNPIAIVNTDGNYRYVGRLVVGFDSQGVLLPETIDSAQSGAFATDDMGLARMGNPEPIAEVAAITNDLGGVLNAIDGTIVGRTNVFLDGRRSQVRSQETAIGNLFEDANLTLARSGEPGVVLSIGNGGGIRAPIGQTFLPQGALSLDDTVFLPPSANSLAGKLEGDISQLDIQTALAFDNLLVNITVTAQELKDILEEAVSAVPETGVGNAGAFPQISGFSFSFDPRLAARFINDPLAPVLDDNGMIVVDDPGQRIRSLLINDNNGALVGGASEIVIQNGIIVGDPQRTFRIVTNEFISRGGDGAPVPDRLDPNTHFVSVGLATQDDLQVLPAIQIQGLSGVVDDPGQFVFSPSGGQQDSASEFLFNHFFDTPFDLNETPVEQDTRIQNLVFRPDTVLD